MADKKLSEQEEIFNTNVSDQVHILRHGVNYKSKVGLLKGAVATDAISGNATFGGITYTGTGLIYDSFSNGAIIDSTFYSNLVVGLNTLSPGDTTNGRIDVWAVEVNVTTEPASLSIVIIEGTPSGTPLKPSVDITKQAELGFRTVPALETADSTTTVNKVYDENVEWTNTTLTTGGNLNEATDPYIGAKNFKTPATVLDSVSWTDSGLTTFNGNDSFKFAARLIVDKDVRIRIKLINSSNNNYWLKTLKEGDFNNFGLDEANPNWQLLQVRLSEFQPNSKTETQFDRVEYTFIDTPILELDRIEFQSDLEQTDPTIINIVEDLTPQLGGELDMNGHSVGGDPQTATGDGTTTIDWKLGNFFNFQFGAFNETFTFIAPTKAGVFYIKLVQDSAGSRTATFPTIKTVEGTLPTLTTTATTGTDILTIVYDGTDYFLVEALNFS